MVSDQKKDIEKFTAEDINGIGKNEVQYESPIDIKFSLLSYISLPLLEWNNEEQPPRFMKLTNSGVSVILSAKWNGPRPFLCKGPLLGDYVFSQMHFHWGPLEEGGSEHTFDGVRMPLEMHVMFFKSEYLCQEEAMKNSDGILCLAFLTELQEEDSIAFKPIVDNLYKIGNAETTQHIELLPLSYFFPPFIDDYYMYWGNVINMHTVLWIICRRPLPISANQIQCFRYIRNHNREMVKSNFRSTKPVQDRKVFHVNPETLNTEHLIIPLAEILTSKVKVKAKPVKTTKAARQNYSSNNIKSINKTFKISDIHYCFGLSESDEADESDEEDTEKEMPTIEKTSIDEESTIKIVFDSITNLKDVNQQNIKSLLGKKDSLKEISKLVELKQETGESYNDYLERMESYLRTVIAKVESEKMKLVRDKNSNNNYDENVNNGKTEVIGAEKLILSENVKQIDIFINNSSNEKTEQQPITKMCIPTYSPIQPENPQINFTQTEKQDVIQLEDPSSIGLKLNNKKSDDSLGKLEGSNLKSSNMKNKINNLPVIPENDLQIDEQNTEKLPKSAKSSKISVINSSNTQQTLPVTENNAVVDVASPVKEQIILDTTNNKLLSEKCTETTNVTYNTDVNVKSNIKKLKSVHTERRDKRSPSNGETVTPGRVRLSPYFKIAKVKKAQSDNYIIQQTPTENKFSNVQGDVQKQTPHTAPTGIERFSNKGAINPDADKLVKRRRPQLKTTMVTEIFMKPDIKPSKTVQEPALANKTKKILRPKKPKTSTPNKPTWKY